MEEDKIKSPDSGELKPEGQESYVPEESFFTYDMTNQDAEDRKDLLTCMPVPYRALRYDLDAFRAWSYLVTAFLGNKGLTRKESKLFTYASLGVACSRRGEKEDAAWYIRQAARMATDCNRDIIKLILAINHILDKIFKS